MFSSLFPFLVPFPAVRVPFARYTVVTIAAAKSAVGLLVLSSFFVTPCALAEEESAPEEEEPASGLFGSETPPFELGWSHGPIIGVVNFGRPFGVSASYAAVVGPESWCKKPVVWGASCAGLLTGAELGLGGGRVGLGAGMVKAGEYHFGVMASGLRAWSNPAFFDGFPVANFRGAEIIAGCGIYHFSVGAYRPANEPSSKPVYAWSLGAGF